jgi:hypothetical protein
MDGKVSGKLRPFSHIVPWHEGVDIDAGPAVCETLAFGQAKPGDDGIHFCCLQRRCDRHPCPAAAVAAGEEAVLPDDGLGSDRPLNNVGVNLDAPVGKKSLEDVSMLGKVLRG